MKFSACGGWFGLDNYSTYKAAADKGYKGVEQLGWLGLDFEKARRAMLENNIISTAIVIQSEDPENMKQIAWGNATTYAETRKAHIDSLRETVAAAKALGVPNIVMTVGSERFDISRQQQHENIVETMKQMAPVVEDAGLMMVLEPLNVLINHKGYYLSSSAEGFDIVREVGSKNVRLLFDIYHQQITEGNVINNIKNNIDLIGHFHIGDNPGRNEPGSGELNYPNIYKAISETGYDGWLAFECGRTVDIDTLCENMDKMIGCYK